MKSLQCLCFYYYLAETNYVKVKAYRRTFKFSYPMGTLTLWVREKYGYPPILITCKDKSDTVAHLVGCLIKRFYPKGTKSVYTTVQHKEVRIHHIIKLANIKDVSYDDPLILDQHVPCKYIWYVFMLQYKFCFVVEVLLDNYKVTPRTNHMWGNEVDLVRALVPEARSFYKFTKMVQKQYCKFRHL